MFKFACLSWLVASPPSNCLATIYIFVLHALYAGCVHPSSTPPWPSLIAVSIFFFFPQCLALATSRSSITSLYRMCDTSLPSMVDTQLWKSKINLVNVSLDCKNADFESLMAVCGLANPTFSRFTPTFSTQMLHGIVQIIPNNVLAKSSFSDWVGLMGKDMDHTWRYVHKHGPHTYVCIEFDMFSSKKILLLSHILTTILMNTNN